MKFTNKILVACTALAAFVSTASAQLGFDTYAATRTVVVQTPIVLAGASTTNATIDLLGFIGTVKLDLCVNTNGQQNSTAGATGAGTLTAAIVGAPNSATNVWTPVAYAQATALSINFTNSALGAGTNVYMTDVYNVPGTNTIPTASTAGYATPYLVKTPMTNTAAITINGSGVYTAGFNATDGPRYLQVVWAATLDKTTNAVVSVVLTGTRSLAYP